MVITAIFLGMFAVTYAAGHLGLSSETDLLFSSDLPWRQRAAAFKAEFPQFQNLLVAVIDAREPEEAEATAAALEQALLADRANFQRVQRPDASPFLRQEGMLFLDRDKLEATLNRIIEAQPFLGTLASDPSARGLFAALGRLGEGIERQQANSAAYQTALSAFHEAIADALAGRPRPLSWIRLLAGETADAGPYKFVLAQPRLDHAEIEPGGAALRAMRDAAKKLEFVRSGEARVRITGSVALADEEFATVAQGAVEGMVASTLLITLWLFLAVRSWRLIVPILGTLGLGLALTLFFAAAAVGTLNLISVGFGILFVGIAVDFAIQFGVRFRETARLTPDMALALAQTTRRAGGQILLAAAATAAGFLSFVPTHFRGVAELGLIAGVGMLIAFLCTMTFLPAAITLVARRAPPGDRLCLGGEAGRGHPPQQPVAAGGVRGVGCLGVALLPRLGFDSNPLHTKDPTTEAMRTLDDLRQSPFANPFTADIIAADAAAAAALSQRLRHLPLVGGVLSINSFVPADQQEKLALIADARDLLRVTLEPRPAPARPEPEQIRAAARTALGQIEPALSRATADPALAALAGDLRRLAAADDAALRAVDRSLTRFLPMLLDRLRDALAAEPVTLESIPPDSGATGSCPTDGRASRSCRSRRRAAASGLRHSSPKSPRSRLRPPVPRRPSWRPARRSSPPSARRRWRVYRDHGDPVRCAAPRA